MKSYLNTLKITLITAICVSYFPLFSAPTNRLELIRATLEHLTNQKDIPSMEEVLEAFGNDMPTLDDLQEIYNNSMRNDEIAGSVEYVRTVGPEIIATLENAFPGGTWAPMGRDSAGFAIFLDAFYTSIGQPQRVKPVRGSGGTIRIPDERLLQKFLLSSGMPSELDTPYVLFDTTSYAAHSQSVFLLKAAYAYYAQQGHSFEDMAPKINMIRFGVQGNNILDQKFPQYFDKLIREYRRVRSGLFPPYPLEIDIRNGQGLTYGSEWHTGYSQLRQRGDGKVLADPGQLSDFHMRIVRMIQAVAFFEIVSHPEFLERVRKEAHHRGFEIDFKTIQTTRTPLTPEIILERTASRLKEMIEAFPPRPEGKQKYYSLNAASLAKWVDDASLYPSAITNDKLLIFLDFIPKVQAAGKIGERDARRLVAKVLSVVQYDTQFEDKLKALLQDNDEVLDIFTEKAWSFYTPATHDIEVVSRRFDVIRRNILEPMECELNLTNPNAQNETENKGPVPPKLAPLPKKGAKRAS